MSPVRCQLQEQKQSVWNAKTRNIPRTYHLSRVLMRRKALLVFLILGCLSLIVSVFLVEHLHSLSFRDTFGPWIKQMDTIVRDSDEKIRLCRIAIISSWHPREFGIATFSADLRKSLEVAGDCDVHVIALNGRQTSFDYGPEVVLTINSIAREDFFRAAAFLNLGDYSAVIVQHEFGMILQSGWEYVEFLQMLRAPTILVLHTPIRFPSVKERACITAMSREATHVVVMSTTSVKDIVGYGIDPERVHYIPHGVFETSLSSNVDKLNEARALEQLPADRPIMTTFGTMHKKKGLHRMIAVLAQVVAEFPDVLYIILGKSFVAQGELDGLINHYKIRRNVYFVDGFVLDEHLTNYLLASDVYVTPHDDYTPTSGTLVYAMALGKCVVSTGYRYAFEVLGGGERGFVIPLGDDEATISGLAEAVIMALRSNVVRETLGHRAQLFMHSHAWKTVAEQYLLLIGKGLQDYGARKQIIDLLNSPPQILLTLPEKIDIGEILAETRDSSHWRNGHDLTTSLAILVDYGIQVNAVCTKVDNSIMMLQADFTFLLPNEEVVQVRSGKHPDILSSSESVIKVEHRSKYRVEGVITASGRYMFYVVATVSGIEISVRFLSPHTGPRGIVGLVLRQRENHAAYPDDTPLSKTLDNFFVTEHSKMHKHVCKDQIWQMNPPGIGSRGLVFDTFQVPTDSLYGSASRKRPLTVVLEGPFIDPEGMATVNLQLGLQLLNERHDNDRTHPISFYARLRVGSNLGADYTRLSSLMGQEMSNELPAEGVDIWIRDYWPAEFHKPLHARVLVQMQPWEFGAIPAEWVDGISENVSELWVPSEFVKNMYVEAGVPDDKVVVIGHGVGSAFEKPIISLEDTHHFQGKCMNKKFKFLYSGGLLARKGIDILLEAYLEEFKKNEDVCLVIHSSYGDGFYAREVENAANSLNGPAVEYLSEYLSDQECIGLYLSSSVFVSAFRSEGYGLPIAEAMALGKTVIVPAAGPVLEYVKEEFGIFVPANLERCLINPCGDRTVFGLPTSKEKQPWWYECDHFELRKRMRWAFNNPEEVARMGLLAREYIFKTETWNNVGEVIRYRLSALALEYGL